MHGQNIQAMGAMRTEVAGVSTVSELWPDVWWVLAWPALSWADNAAPAAPRLPKARATAKVPRIAQVRAVFFECLPRRFVAGDNHV
jgi:hypothetical protein